MAEWNTDFLGVEDDESYDWTAPVFDPVAEAEADWEAIDDEDPPANVSDKDWLKWFDDKNSPCRTPVPMPLSRVT
jgi:hypothetical protein